MQYGCQSEVGKIEKLLLKHPQEGWINGDYVAAQWRELNYTGRPEYVTACQEYDAFVALLKRVVPEIHFLPRSNQTGLDSVYVRDSSLVTRAGAILCNMGKENRRGEPVAAREFYQDSGIPILGEITGEGRLEGGDVVWLDEKTLIVGEGYRTNAEGIRQLREYTNELVDEFVVVPLPHWNGPDDVFHLMSMLSPVDHNLAVVYSRLMPVPFRRWLMARGIKLIEVADAEYASMACNILAVAPRKCIMLSGNPLTKQKLENEGVEICEYRGVEVSQKGGGGPTCLTRPLLRGK
ncbi:dimethylarginine dimethylaminohydrolase family protein [Candidatus Zixiibacteriota bacterium]